MEHGTWRGKYGLRTVESSPFRRQSEIDRKIYFVFLQICADMFRYPSYLFIAINLIQPWTYLLFGPTIYIYIEWQMDWRHWKSSVHKTHLACFFKDFRCKRDEAFRRSIYGTIYPKWRDLWWDETTILLNTEESEQVIQSRKKCRCW